MMAVMTISSAMSALGTRRDAADSVLPLREWIAVERGTGRRRMLHGRTFASALRSARLSRDSWVYDSDVELS